MVPENCRELADAEIVMRVRGGETGLFELLMRRHNQRVFRAIRSVILDDSEAEDVLQDAWVRAYEHLGQFENRASFRTWITKIAIHESLARARKANRETAFDEGETPMNQSNSENPEEQALRSELIEALRSAVDRLPATYRSVFILRDVEGLSTSETAQCLDLSEEAVKTRLHRSRTMLRTDLGGQIGPLATRLHPFLGHRCDRSVAFVMHRIHAGDNHPEGHAG